MTLVATPVAPVDDPSLDPTRLGGKGAWLRRLVAAGLPVPPTCVVSTDVYRLVEASPEVATLRSRIVGGEQVPADEVDAVFLRAALPTAVGDHVTSAARDLAGRGALAVRSSASVEDTEACSFAGQYRSFLEIEPDDVLRAVRLTWASLWHPAPCAYRRAWSIDEDGIAMAVVLMPMVDAIDAGVVFTRDPLNPAQVRIESVTGLGEALVSGSRTPAVHHVPRGRIEGSDLPPHVVEAARLAMEVEDLLGAPQDVEWAHDGARVWILQARPVTGAGDGGDGADTATDDHELTTAGIAEMLPGVLPPLVWDVNSLLVEEALRSVLDTVAGTPPGWSSPHVLIRRVRGRAALDLDALRRVADEVPGTSSLELERQYFGGGPPPPQAGGGDRVRSVVHGLRSATARRRAEREAEIVVAAIDRVVADPIDLATLADRELLAYRARARDLAVRAMTAELATAAAAAASYARLEAVLSRHVGDEAAATAQKVTTGCGALVTPAPGASRRVVAGERWDESSTPPPVPPGATASVDRHAALTALGDRLRRDPAWRRTRWLSGQLVDVRWHVLRRLADDAATGLVRRERAKAAVLALGGELRRVHLELGHRLVDAGLLDDPLSVDLLREWELGPAVTRGVVPCRGELQRRRRWLESRQLDDPLPERFVGDAPPTAAATFGTSDVVTGLAASPGRSRGRARVLSTPTPGSLRPGEVLVAAATDASWSPLFVEAAGVVVERGGPLSHAAIVARELGVPAVVGVRGARAMLDGRDVLVDGDRGEVTILESAP